MDAKTPLQWLGELTRRMDQRRKTVGVLQSYVDGNAPMPEMSQETAESWRMFQEKARTNWGKLIVDSVVDRVIPTGISVGGESDSDLAKAAQMIYRDNRMDSVIKDWVRAGMTFGQSYLTIWGSGVSGDSKSVAVTWDSPQTMCVSTNPLQPWRPEAAVKVWRDVAQRKDFAMVWTATEWAQFERPAKVKVEQGVKADTWSWVDSYAEGQWVWTGEGGPADGVPIVVYNNPGGTSDFEAHIDLINRINMGCLERLTIMAMQAFRQRAVKGGLLPERDENGNKIDYSKTFAPAPGALWNLPENLDIWESEQVSVEPMLSAAKDDIRQLSAVTRTPLPMLMPDSANISAEGAKGTENSFVFRCKDRISEAKLGVEVALVKALQLSGNKVGDDETVEVFFEPAERVTMMEKYIAAKQAADAGESWRSIQRHVLGRTPEQIAQDALDRASESLLNAASQPQPPAPPDRTRRQLPTPQEPTQAQGEPVPPRS